MSKTFRFLLWYVCLPAALLIFVYPPKIHGYLNPYDEGLWLGVAQALTEGKILYRDVFFHYGPIIPWGLGWALHRFIPTLSLVRMVFWSMNAAALFIITACFLRVIHNKFLRLVLIFSVWCVPLAAHVLTIPMAARYGMPFASILCWSFETDNRSSLWAICAGIFAALAFWTSQEVGTAVIISGLVYTLLGKHRQGTRHFLSGCIAGSSIAALGLGVTGLHAYWQCAVSDTATIFFRDAIPFPGWDAHLLSQAFHGFIPFLMAWRSLASTSALLFPALSYLAILGWEIRLFLNHRTWDRWALALTVYGSMTAVTAWTQPDRWHIYFALTPALLLWGYVAQSAAPAKRRPVMIGLVSAAALLLTLPHAIMAWQKEQLTFTVMERSTIERAGISRIPSGQAEGYEALVQEMDRQIPKNQKFVFYPYDGTIYFLTDRTNPTFFPVLALAVSEPMQERIVKDIDHADVQWVIQDTEDNAFKGIPIEKFFAPVDRYIKTHFVLKSSLGPFHFLERLTPKSPHK